MGAQVKLTKQFVDSATPGERGAQAFFWDRDTRGFGLRVGLQDRAYIAQGRVAGRTIRYTIGKHGVFTPEQARKRARAVLVDMEKGIDPNAQKAENRVKGLTLIQLFDDFKASRNKKLKARTLYDYERIMRVYLSNWRNKPVRELTPGMIERKHAELGEASQAQANLCMRFLRSLFNYASACTTAHGRALVDGNPVTVLTKKKAWFNINARSTYINPTDLKSWWLGVQSLENETLRDYLRLVLLTGLRRGEGERLTWSNVDLKARTLTVRDTKNRRDHTLPLSDYLLELLQRRRKNEDKKKSEDQSPYVFAGNGVSGHLVEPKRSIGKVTDESGIDFTIHDLRRTFASIVNRLDKTLSYYTIKRLLNHSMSGDVTTNYVQHDVEQLREGMQEITDYVLKSAGQLDTASVSLIKASS